MTAAVELTAAMSMIAGEPDYSAGSVPVAAARFLNRPVTAKRRSAPGAADDRPDYGGPGHRMEMAAAPAERAGSLPGCLQEDPSQPVLCAADGPADSGVVAGPGCRWTRALAAKPSRFLPSKATSAWNRLVKKVCHGRPNGRARRHRDRSHDDPAAAPASGRQWSAMESYAADPRWRAHHDRNGDD